MYLKTMKRILALAATALLAFGAEAAENYSYWKGGVSGNWNNEANWSGYNDGKHEYLISGYNGYNRFTNNVTVTVDATFDLKGVYLNENVDVTLVGDTSTDRRLHYYAGGLKGASGSALRLQNVMLQERGGNSYPNAVISVPTFEVMDGGTVWFAVNAKYASKTVQISSPISGSGTIDIQNTDAAGTTLRFQGDNTAFAGMFNMSGANNAQKVIFENLNSVSANAKWHLECAKEGGITVCVAESGALKFGELTGSGAISNVSESAEVSLEVGALNTDFTNGMNVCGMSVKKVGTGTMMWCGSNVSNLTVAGGSVTLAAGTVLDSLTLDGGTLEAVDLSSITTMNVSIDALTVANPGTLDFATIPLTGVPDGYTAMRDTSEPGKLAVTIAANDTYVWTGNGLDDKWSTLDNWKLADGTAATAVPGSGKVVIFPSTLDSATVTMDYTTGKNNRSYCDVATLAANCAVLFVGTSDEYLLRVTSRSILGDGVLSFKGSGLYTYDGGTLTVNNDIVILSKDGDESWSSFTEFYIRGGKNKYALSGNISGAGYLKLMPDGNSSESFTLTGDVSEFTGKITFGETTALNAVAATKFGSATIDIASGKVLQVNAYDEDNTFKVGALMGSGTLKQNSANAFTLEVGALNANTEAATVLTQNDGVDVWTVKKVGTGTQTFTDETVAYNVDLTAGELGVPPGKGFGAVALNGGKFNFTIPYDSPWTNGTAQTLFTCTSGVEAERTVDYVTLDMGAFKAIYDVEYDNSVANVLKVTLTPSTDIMVWKGLSGGYWSDNTNWVVKGTEESPLVAPGAGTAVEIGKDALIAVAPGQLFGTVTADASAKLAVMFTDDALTFTAPADFAGTVVAAGPYSMTSAGGVYTAKRVPSTFVWTDATADHEWNTVANWKVGNLPTAVPPNVNDNAEFPAKDGGWTLAVSESEANASNVTFVANVAISHCTAYLRPRHVIGGEGVITLGDDAMIASYDTGLSVSNDLIVTASDANPAQFYITGSNRSITLFGDITGSGTMQSTCAKNANYSGVHFHGDLRAFTGRFVAPANNIDRNQTQFEGEYSWSENARFEVSAGSGDTCAYGGNTFKFGAFSGKMNFADQQVKNMTIEVGNLNSADDDIAGTFFAGQYPNLTAERGHTLRKVGTGTLEVSVINNKAYDVNAGVMRLMSDRTIRTMWKPKGNASEIVTDPAEATGSNDVSIAFSGTGTLALNSEVTLDISGLIANSTGAVAVDDEGKDYTWATALAASNVGGFTKKGAGTLTLTAIPAYTGLTTVEAGKLVVPSGTVVTLNAASLGTFEGGTITQAIFTEGTVTTNVVADSSEADIRSYACPIDYSNVTVDLSEKTDWDEGATYYVVTPAGIVAGTSIERDGCELILPEEQQSKWTLGTVNLTGYGKVLALVSRAGLIITIR